MGVVAGLLGWLFGITNTAWRSTSASVLFVSFILSACAASSQNRVESAVPQNYRELVASSLRPTLKDPYSLRDAQISEPTTLPLLLGTQAVCVRFNAKNSYGAYTGLQTAAFVFSSGSARQVVAAGCSDVPYSPFPELESSGQLTETVAEAAPSPPKEPAKGLPAKRQSAVAGMVLDSQVIACPEKSAVITVGVASGIVAGAVNDAVNSGSLSEVWHASAGPTDIMTFMAKHGCKVFDVGQRVIVNGSLRGEPHLVSIMKADDPAASYWTYSNTVHAKISASK